jgi:type III secretion system FlhB-like substrate exporter
MVAKLLNYKIKSEITDAWYVVAQLIVFLKSYQRLFPEC